MWRFVKIIIIYKLGINYRAIHMLSEIQIAGDGHCLYRAVGYQMPCGEDQHKRVRSEIVNEVRTERKHYIPFFDDGRSRQEWLRKQTANDWGDDITCRAAAKLYSKPIIVWRKTSEQAPVIFAPPVLDINKDLSVMYLLLDERNKGSEHYSVLQMAQSPEQSSSRVGEPPISPKRKLRVLVTPTSPKRPTSGGIMAQSPSKRNRCILKRRLIKKTPQFARKNTGVGSPKRKFKDAFIPMSPKPSTKKTVMERSPGNVNLINMNHIIYTHAQDKI